MANGTLTSTATTVNFTDSVTLRRPRAHASGTFSGCTMTWQFKDGSTWRSIATATCTAAADFTLDFERGVEVRGLITGGTAAPSVSWVIV